MALFQPHSGFETTTQILSITPLITELQITSRHGNRGNDLDGGQSSHLVSHES